VSIVLKAVAIALAELLTKKLVLAVPALKPIMPPASDPLVIVVTVAMAFVPYRVDLMTNGSTFPPTVEPEKVTSHE
jgi:hypothetical protein